MLNWELLTRQNECSKYLKFNLAMYCVVYFTHCVLDLSVSFCQTGQRAYCSVINLHPHTSEMLLKLWLLLLLGSSRSSSSRIQQYSSSFVNLVPPNPKGNPLANKGHQEKCSLDTVAIVELLESKLSGFKPLTEIHVCILFQLLLTTYLRYRERRFTQQRSQLCPKSRGGRRCGLQGRTTTALL